MKCHNNGKVWDYFIGNWHPCECKVCLKPKRKIQMKEYQCPLSETKICRYGGNKRYSYGFMSGTSNYCRKDKKWVHDLKQCPLTANVVETNRKGNMQDKKIGICEECQALFLEKELMPGQINKALEEDDKWAHVCKAKKYRQEHRCESYVHTYSKDTPNVVAESDR